VPLRALSAGNAGQTPPLQTHMAASIEVVPVDGLEIAVVRFIRERHKAACGDFTDGFARRAGDGTVQFVLGHRCLQESSQKKQPLRHSGTVAEVSWAPENWCAKLTDCGSLGAVLSLMLVGFTLPRLV